MQNFGMSMLWFWIAYFVVTDIGVLHTIFNIKVLKMKSMKESEGMGEGYEKTKPWHPLYNIIIFPIFGYLYLKGINDVTIIYALITGVIWSLISIIGDLVGWVLIKHPWRLTFKEFYIDYQPWITIIYIAILIAPVISYLFI